MLRPLVLSVIALTALWLGVLCPSSGHAEVYKWIDKRGTVHYTDDPEQLPEPYRSQALKELGERLKKQQEEPQPNPGAAPPAPAAAPATPAPSTQEQLQGLTDSLQRVEAAKRSWQQKAALARQNVTQLEQECAKLRTKRDLAQRNSLNYARPVDRATAQQSEKDLERCDKALAEARRYSTDELPEQARRQGIPPGWLR